MIYDMACRAWHGIWYGQARYGMVYDITWRAWPGTLYDLERYGIVYCTYDKAWRGTACVNLMFYGIALGYGPVYIWSSR